MMMVTQERGKVASCGLLITAVTDQGKHMKIHIGGNVMTKARNRIPIRVNCHIGPEN